ncbi:MAG: hypothetical protein Q9169_005997 [Polycauliona sp. 2 TL-2023]
MYASSLVSVFGAAVGLLPPLVSSAPTTAHVKRAPAPTGSGTQFLGSLTWYPQQPDLILATVSNNSTAHYAILAKNNLFDDLHPYKPLQVIDQSGKSVAIVGSRHPYPNIEDAQFRDFPPGMVWERYLNMSAYMPPFPDIQSPESRCFGFQLPSSVEALVIDDTKPNQHLADIFLTQGITQVPLVSNPIHQNVTISPGEMIPDVVGMPSTQVTPTDQPAGVFLPTDVQSGQVINPLQGLTAVGDAPGFIINSKAYSKVQASPETA